jgi:uncharacterized protein (DUF1697 family)
VLSSGNVAFHARASTSGALERRAAARAFRCAHPEVDCDRGLHGIRAKPERSVFMSLLERTFGKEITTRTLETVRRCARA